MFGIHLIVLIGVQKFFFFWLLECSRIKWRVQEWRTIWKLGLCRGLEGHQGFRVQCFGFRGRVLDKPRALRFQGLG